MSEGRGNEKQGRYCANCGAPMRSGNAFCTSCGVRHGSVGDAGSKHPKESSPWESARGAFEKAGATYRRWDEERSAKRERDELLRRAAEERGQRSKVFNRYNDFFTRASEGSRSSLEWWQAFDEGEFNEGEFNEGDSSVSDLLGSAADRADSELSRLRDSEKRFAGMLRRNSLDEADRLLRGFGTGQEDFGGERSVFPPLVEVHGRIRRSETWANYRHELEKFVRDLEDLLDSPGVRTVPANRARFPDPEGERSVGLGRTSLGDPPSRGSDGGKDCPVCGTRNVPQAAFCRRCGSGMSAAGATEANVGAVVAGYVIACLPLLLLPIVFTPAGVGLGIFNMVQGQSGHGVAQIAIACLTGVLGTFIGGAGLGI